MPHFIDLPRNSTLIDGVPILSGWYASSSEASLDDVQLIMPDERSLPFMRVQRPDVETLFTGHQVLGFTALIDRNYWSCGRISIRLERKGELLEDFAIEVAPEAPEMIDLTWKQKLKKRAWCLEHARCPVCTNTDLEAQPSMLRCTVCGTVYRQEAAALNLMPPALYAALDPQHAAATSANTYDHTCYRIMEEVSANGGMMLDCGAGLRPEPNHSVINFEIGEYPSTDVLGVGSALPFRDGVFDAALSLTVLEHVPDPFECAKELMRVLKPGGQLYVKVPFLQPEHGYPHHFFNMTREGLRTLFPRMEVVSHSVADYGKPIFALHWMLKGYAARLSPETRQRFLSMTVGNLLSREPHQYLDDPLSRDLSEEGNWVLASETSLQLRKP